MTSGNAGLSLNTGSLYGLLKRLFRSAGLRQCGGVSILLDSDTTQVPGPNAIYAK